MDNSQHDKTSNTTHDMLYLTDLIDVEMLQKIQDAFGEFTGMAVVSVDTKGAPVTKSTNFTDFCNKYTRSTEIGNRRCEECDIRSAEITFQTGKTTSYYCHAGLVDFAAPIMAGDTMVGGFIGGQILTEPPDLEKFAKMAEKIGVDPDEYVEAVKKVQIVSKETVDKASNFLYIVASALSNMAYKSHQLHESAIEIEKASRMKSDFLANMSHEIRTPMNAIIGLADLALREEMSPIARDYIHQVKASSKNLLVIINDILDFSKIESGKMDILEVEYEPLSLINDLTSIINNRIGSKDIEFIMDIAPDLPKNLYGDNVRIHQIMLNLLTNAVKFTHQGEIRLELSVERIESDMLMMNVTIRDTGIGIKKSDLHKLFTSFQQVDSKRNRNIEGTGLGLAISQQLINLMHGTISVESEYNKGSAFSFRLPQRIIDDIPAVPGLESPVSAAVLVKNPYVKKQLIKDLNWIGASCIDLAESNDFEALNIDFVFVEKVLFSQTVQNFLQDNPSMRCVVLSEYDSFETVDMPNVKVISKPAYSLSIYNAMGVADINVVSEESDRETTFNFVAPDARILVVDDNPVNLTVAVGLLEPLRMNIDTASSASEAIDVIHKVQYDLIFMDHMMPEVDGIEATHIIRQLVPSYNDIPIIALTANAIGGAKDMFLREGMNDFCAKPIDVKDIVSKLKNWLPKEKILPASDISRGSVQDIPDTGADTGEITLSNIHELNTGAAIALLGSENLYRAVLKEYYCSIDKKCASIREHYKAEQWRDYTIEVHSLKSTSKQIGADHVSSMAAELEKAGNEGNTELILQNTEKMLEKYSELKDILRPYFPECEEPEEKRQQSEDIFDLLEKMHEALDNFDTLQVDEVIEQMSAYSFSQEQQELFEELKSCAEAGDIDKCSEVTRRWSKVIASSRDNVPKGEELKAFLDKMEKALEDFDTLEIDEVIEQMAQKRYAEDQELFEELRKCAEAYDVDGCGKIMESWREKIGE